MTGRLEGRRDSSGLLSTCLRYTGRHLGGSRRAGLSLQLPCTLGVGAFGHASELDQHPVLLCKGLILAARWLLGCSEGQVDGAFRKDRVAHFSREKTGTQIPCELLPGCILTNIYDLNFVCSFLVSLVLCVVILGCDLHPFRFICVVECREHPAFRMLLRVCVFALPLFTLVLLYFSSLILFSFSTLPLCSEDLLALVRMQGLE